MPYCCTQCSALDAPEDDPVVVCLGCGAELVWDGEIPDVYRCECGETRDLAWERKI